MRQLAGALGVGIERSAGYFVHTQHAPGYWVV